MHLNIVETRSRFIGDTFPHIPYLCRSIVVGGSHEHDFNQLGKCSCILCFDFICVFHGLCIVHFGGVFVMCNITTLLRVVA